MFKERTSSNATLLAIKRFELDGKQQAGICRESKEDRPGFVKVMVFNPNTQQQQPKWLKIYDEIEAYIAKVEWYDREDAASQSHFSGIALHLVDEQGEQAVLSLPYGKSVFEKFCMVAENIDFTKPVNFRAWKSVNDKGKDVTAFNLKQAGQSVKHVYTKDNPGEMPPAEQSKTTRKWSFDKRNDWLVDRVLTVVAPRADAASKERGTLTPAARQQDEYETPAQADDEWFTDDEPETPQQAGQRLFQQGAVKLNLKTRNYTVQDNGVNDEPCIVWKDDQQIIQCDCQGDERRKTKDAPQCAHIYAVFYHSDARRSAAA